MNTLAWIAAVIAFLALGYMFETEFSTVTFSMIAWVCWGVALWCFAMGVNALLDDMQGSGGFRS
jgi:hypothetical protein